MSQTLRRRERARSRPGWWGKGARTSGEATGQQRLCWKPTPETNPSQIPGSVIRPLTSHPEVTSNPYFPKDRSRGTPTVVIFVRECLKRHYSWFSAIDGRNQRGVASGSPPSIGSVAPVVGVCLVRKKRIPLATSSADTRTFNKFRSR